MPLSGRRVFFCIAKKKQDFYLLVLCRQTGHCSERSASARRKVLVLARFGARPKTSGNTEGTKVTKVSPRISCPWAFVGRLFSFGYAESGMVHTGYRAGSLFFRNKTSCLPNPAKPQSPPPSHYHSPSAPAPPQSSSRSTRLPYRHPAAPPAPHPATSCRPHRCTAKTGHPPQ